MRIPDPVNLELPQIDNTTLPDIDCLTAIFGSLADGPRRQALDDNHALLMPCLYELHPGT